MKPCTALLACLAIVFAASGCSRTSQVGALPDTQSLREALVQQAAARDVVPAAEAAAALQSQRQMLAALRSDEAGEAAGASDLRPGGDAGAELLLNAPAAESAEAAGGDAAAPLSAVTSGQPAPTQSDCWWQKPLAGRSLGTVIKDDAKQFHRELWKSTKDSATLPGAGVLLGALALSGVSRTSWDHRIDHSWQYDHSQSANLFTKAGQFGEVVGNPGLHFGLAMAGYGLGIQTQNDQLYGFSKTLMQALILDDAATIGLKLATHVHSPDGDDSFDWPSGHTSSMATVAGVAWEYYGWPVGVPAYLLTGWVGASMEHNRKHWMSDVIFGAALGAVIGHSTAHGRLLDVGGFRVMPYADGDGGGVAFVKDF